MSPEQAEGKPVDARSDIFAFGAVLYEMVTGRRAFRGDTKLSVLSAILKEDPQPASSVRKEVPHELERIITRCLRKDPERRFQHMDDLKVALEEVKEESESGASGVAPAVKKPTRRWLWLGSGAAALALCAALLFLLPRWRESQEPLREVPLASYLGDPGDPALSPDGNQFAFSWNGGQEQSPRQLYLSLVGRGTPLRLTNYPHGSVSEIAWSPDGQTIAFIRSGKLILIPALGGPERDLGPADFRPGWSPDGKWLYISVREMPADRRCSAFVQPAAGGERRRLIDPPPAGGYGDIYPSVSPDGKHLSFVRSLADSNEDIMVADLRDDKVDAPVASAHQRAPSDEVARLDS